MTAELLNHTSQWRLEWLHGWLFGKLHREANAFLRRRIKRLLWQTEQELNKRDNRARQAMKNLTKADKKAIYQAALPSKMATAGAKGAATITKPAPGGAMSITQF